MDNTFSNRCRACAVLICSEKMISLFENSLSDMFTHCTSLEISSNDSLPSRICPECFGQLSDLNKFRQNCVNSDAYFREQDLSDRFYVNTLTYAQSEFFETEYIDEGFAQYDPDLGASNTVTSAEDTKAIKTAKYICDYCGKQFNQKNHIGAHMATHYTIRSKTFACAVKGCRKVFKGRQSLKNHRLKVHNLESEPGAKAAAQTVKLNCPQCPKSFDIQVKLDAHIRSYHHGLKAYKCEQCEKEFCMYRSLRRHLQSRHSSEESEKHDCPYDGCDKSYRFLDSLRKHMDQIHMGMVRQPVNRRKFICDPDFESEFFATPIAVTSAKDAKATNTAKYICDYCSKQFNQKNHIAAHMATHYTVRPKTFACTVKGCCKTFKCSKSLKSHKLKVHNLESEPGAKDATQRVKLKCPQCPKSFDMQLKLDAHIRSYHHGLKAYKCEQCETEFSTYRSLRRHLRSRHGPKETEKHDCPHDGCDKSYRFLEYLKKHMDRIHLGVVRQPVNRRNNFICDQCGRSFRCGFRLKEHSYSHSGITPFACKICPKKFASNFKLKIHTERHQKRFQCPTCSLRLSTSGALKAHLNFHSKEITYPCKECPRVFASYSAITRHVRIHHRNHRPYICPHCDRAFTKAETMKNHIMTHTGEKPFSCSVCGHRFIQGVALKAHMKVHAKKLS